MRAVATTTTQQKSFGKQVFPKRTKEKPMQQKDTCENTIVLQKVNVGIIQMLRLLK